MVFSSAVFIFCFLPIVLLIYYGFLRSIKSRNIFLFIASLIFYAWGEPLYVLLMVLSILCNWKCGLKIGVGREKKKWLIGGICYNLLVLFIFKYLAFFCQPILNLLGVEKNIDIALPIGISFYTFQAISYLVDVYWERGKAQKNVLNLGLYIALFPQLIAGPIVRYETIEKEISERSVCAVDFKRGIERFIVGLAKKCILANNLAYVVDYSWNNVGHQTVGTAWLGAFVYVLQVYFDFSGYSDMAIGLGQMFGFHFLENFKHPYIATSITDFWSRWHISLSSWLKDYIFTPLSLNRNFRKKIRNKNVRMFIALFVVWFVTGLWHGASWNFVMWGMLYFALLMLEKNTALSKIPKWIGHIYVIFNIIWINVFFRAKSISEALLYLKDMVGVPSSSAETNFLLYANAAKGYILLGVLACFPWGKYVKEKFDVPAWVGDVVYMLVFLVALTYMIQNAYNPFIYFNF